MKLAVTTTEKKKTVTDAPEAQAQVQGAAITGSAAPSAEQQKTSPWRSLLQQMGYKPMSSSTTYPMPRPTTQQTTPETPASSSGTEAQAGNTGGVGTAQVTGQTQGTPAGSPTGTTTTTKITYTPPEFKEAE